MSEHKDTNRGVLVNAFSDAVASETDGQELFDEIIHRLARTELLERVAEDTARLLVSLPIEYVPMAMHNRHKQVADALAALAEFDREAE